MNPRTLLQRHRALRWLAPAGVVGVMAIVATGVFHDPPAPKRALPTTSPSSLLAGVQTSPATGMSGTVVTMLRLGLPELPQIGVPGTGSSLPSLLSGAHTMQVWFGGAQQQRIALLGSTDETDLFRNGRTLWEWSSATRTAFHLKLPADTPAPLVLPSTDPASMTPPAVAQRTLADLDPATKVEVRNGGTVADRSTYQLVLTPRTSRTRIRSVHISVDGATKVPLAVAVYAHGDRKPSLDVAFTAVRFEAPPARNFTFTPPHGAIVHKLHMAGTTKAAHSSGSSGTHRLPPVPTVHTLGSSWTQIVTAHLPKAAVREVRRSMVYQSLRPVAGSWGSGRLLSSDLVSALLTDDGRLYVGCVDPSALYAAAHR